MKIEYLTAGHARLILHIYFGVVFTAIVFFANRTRRSLARRKFCQDGKVPVSHLLGWMRAGDVLSTWWYMRAPPGGLVAAILMLVVFGLAFAVPTVTTTLVTTVPVNGSCLFTSGLVMNQSANPSLQNPQQNSIAYTYAMQGQNNSLWNGGEVGIYKKVDLNPRFFASHDDVLTAWTCDYDGGDQSFSSDTSALDIIANLTQRNLLFNQGNASYQYGGWQDDPLIDWSSNLNQFVVWSGLSTYDSTSFEIRTALQSTHGTNFTSMTIVHCVLDNPRAVQNITQWINLNQTLAEWIIGLQGMMYYGKGADLDYSATWDMQQYLNAMIMVQGGDDSINSTIPVTDEVNRVENCLVDGAYIPVVIEVFFVLFGATAILAGLSWMAASALYHGQRDHAKHMPYGLMDLIIQIGRERDIAHEESQVLLYNERDVGQWHLTAESDGDVPRLTTVASNTGTVSQTVVKDSTKQGTTVTEQVVRPVSPLSEHERKI